MLTGPTDVRYNENTRAISVSSVETPDNNVEEQGVAIVYITFSPGLPSTSNVYNVGFMSNAVELELDCNLPDAVDKGEDV